MWQIEQNKTADGDVIICVVSGCKTLWQGYESPKNKALAQEIADALNGASVSDFVRLTCA